MLAHPTLAASKIETTIGLCLTKSGVVITVPGHASLNAPTRDSPTSLENGRVNAIAVMIMTTTSTGVPVVVTAAEIM